MFVPIFKTQDMCPFHYILTLTFPGITNELFHKISQDLQDFYTYSNFRTLEQTSRHNHTQHTVCTYMENEKCYLQCIIYVST